MSNLIWCMSGLIGGLLFLYLIWDNSEDITFGVLLPILLAGAMLGIISLVFSTIAFIFFKSDFVIIKGKT